MFKRLQDYVKLIYLRSILWNIRQYLPNPINKLTGLNFFISFDGELTWPKSKDNCKQDNETKAAVRHPEVPVLGGKKAHNKLLVENC